MNCSMNLPAYPTTASSRMPGIRPAGLTGAAVGAGVAGAGVRRAELAMDLPLSRDRSYQGMVFRMPKRTSNAAASASRTAQESRETRRSGDELDICGYSYEERLNGMRGLNFREERKLATTTGGEPVHSAARDGRSGIVHKADFTIAPKTTQGSPPPENPSVPNRSVIPTVAYPDFLPRRTGQGHVC